MIVNIKEIFERLSDGDDWEPIVFENHRGEKLRFEQVATIEYEGKNYAYLYEINKRDEHVNDFPVVVLLEEENGAPSLDFVTDQRLIEDIAYEVVRMRRGNLEDEADEAVSDMEEEFLDEEEYYEEEKEKFNP